jgi:hypothetical protein
MTARLRVYHPVEPRVSVGDAKITVHLHLLALSLSEHDAIVLAEQLIDAVTALRSRQ